MSEASGSTLAVGVTGHRFLADPEKIALGVDRAVSAIQDRWPGRSLTILSALAEGADQIAAARLVELGARLVVPLPLPGVEYVETFESREAERRFNGLLRKAQEVVRLLPAPTHHIAYGNLTEYLLEQSDVLMAIWDGNASQEAGGTATVVAGARERAMPIAWIHAGNRVPGTTEPTTLGGDQGKLTLENF